jgi:nitrogen-specific signal transduction histidine kinase
VIVVLVVAPDDARRVRFQRALREHAVLGAASDAEALRIAGYVDVDVVVRDSGERPRGLAEFVAALPPTSSGLVITVGPGEEGAVIEFSVPSDADDHALRVAVDRAGEKRRLMREVDRLRTRPAEFTAIPDPAWDGDALSRTLKELTRAFAAGFDRPRVLATFLAAIGELVRPSRMALLLEDVEGGFTVAAHRGLPLPLASAVRLSTAGDLTRWLRRHGRPVRLIDADVDIARELTLLHSDVAVPLLAHGELVGLLALGHPVVRSGYGARELETVFDLATHLATMLRDIALHHELARAKEFNERILTHMASGVVTIGRDHRIGTLNRRAEDILGLDGATVGQDLRHLPSPLGDMLFETLTTGRALARSEIELALGRRWLEVATYPIRGDEAAPLGAVLVFEDVTAQKELAGQRRQTEQLELLTSVVARIADEIKNPLVSINTFVELMEERVDDPDFRKDFAGVVRRDARRLVQVFEKLAGLVSEGELHSSVVEVHSVVDDVVASLRTGDETGERQPLIDVTGEPPSPRARIDVAQFRRVLAYLVGYLVHNSPVDPAKVSISVARATDSDGLDTARVMIASRTASVAVDVLQHLFDPVRMVLQENLIHVGPAVSQRIVDALGGRLRLRQSRAEIAFVVTLPLES